MLAFYRTVRFDDVDLAGNGDMLLYQWGTYDWGRGESFEFDITRQLILGTGEDEDIFQLSLTFKFQPTVALLQLGAGNRWRRSLEEVEEFRSFTDRPRDAQLGARLHRHELHTCGGRAAGFAGNG